MIINPIANAIIIFRDRVENTLHNEFVMTNVSARWLARRLTPDQKPKADDITTGKTAIV